MPRLVERVKQLPRGVLVFAVLVLLYDAALLVVDWGWLAANPFAGALRFGFSFGVLAALVIWRQRWAWWIAFIGPLVSLASPVWGSRFRPVTDLVELVFIAAILTPTIRRHVGVLTRHPTSTPRRVSRPGRAALTASGVLTVFVMVPVEPRHTTGSLSTQIITGVVLWLLLAGLLRLAIWLGMALQRQVARFARHPPPTG